MNVSGVSSKAYEQLSTMKKLNSASDNAAGLAIVEKLNSQENGYNKGTENAEAGQDMYRVAEGGLSSITDSLQRMRELSLQAMNVTYGDSEKSAIQDEIEGLKASIQDAAKGTQFNTLKLLDGSMTDKMLATNPDGSGMKIELSDSTIESLGIADYDVTKEIDISKIDQALNMVNKYRSGIGANSNRLEHTIQYNNYAALNLAESSSRIEDADVAKSVSDLKKDQILNQYRMFAMRAKNDQARKGISALLGN
ncbi:flagellin [Mobilitalea sibirica]|uniref:Flagellin n=1 Tax=Mobilitalea sibirica TaxID=1462919 RepID=A0A8J7HAQ2_9FIRM|nr:flagellin [Mobilitalea sibirica]